MRPVNEEEVLRELDRCTRGYGNGVGLARELKIEPRRLHEVKSGARRIIREIAEGLGYELRWVKKQRNGNGDKNT